MECYTMNYKISISRKTANIALQFKGIDNYYFIALASRYFRRTPLHLYCNIKYKVNATIRTI